MVAVIVQEAWSRAIGWRSTPTASSEVLPHFASLDGRQALRQVRRAARSTCAATARRIAAAASVATFEDLGVQMNRHSTLVSYLHKLLVLLTGNFGKKGAAFGRARSCRSRPAATAARREQTHAGDRRARSSAD